MDDADIAEKIAPELRNIRILKSVEENFKAQYADKTKCITLRILLTDTGMMYN